MLKNEKPIKLPVRSDKPQYGELLPLERGDTYLYTEAFTGDVRIVRTNNPDVPYGYSDDSIFDPNVGGVKVNNVLGDSSYDVVLEDRFTMVNVSMGPEGTLINLPLTSGNNGKGIIIKRIDAPASPPIYTVTVAAYGSPQEYIDNYDTSPPQLTQITLDDQNEYVWLICDEFSSAYGKWQIVSQTAVVSGGGTFTSPLTTKGDIYTRTTVDARLPVGSNGQILAANSATSTGLEWIPNTAAGLITAVASGTDTYTATITGVTSYSDGDAYLIRFTNGNTTTCTLNINSLGAKTLYRNNDGQLIGGDIISGAEMLCVYNSTLNAFQVIGVAPNTLIAYVTNDDSVTLTKGMAVYAFSGTGDRMTVKRAYNTGDSTSAQTVGLVLSSSIAANQKGFIMMQGLLDGLSILPTSTWADGDTVYLGSTPGSITNVKPSAPNHLVYLGVVTTASNGAAGRLYVKVQNGYELNEIHNVSLSSPPNNNDGLFYETSTSLWKNKSIATVLGYTPVTNARTLTINGTAYDLSADRTWSVGTLTSVSAGTGMNFTTITSTGSVAIDDTKVPYLSGGFSTGLLKWNGSAWTFDNSTYLTAAITSLNGLTGATQTFVNDTNVTIVSSGTTHTITWSGTLADNRIASASTWNAKIGGSGTTNEIAYFTASGTIGSLTTGTYPSLTELSYVKGVTSAIQTQLNYRAGDTARAYQLLGSTAKAMLLGVTVRDITASAALASQQLRLLPIYIPFTMTLTGVTWYQATAGNYTANNYNGVGLYTYSGGTLTLVASSTDDGNIWKATSGSWNSKAFSSTYSAAEGIYYVGLLYSSSAQTTAPALGGIAAPLGGSGNVYPVNFTNSAKLFGTLASQTSLPATQAMSGVSATTAAAQFVMVY